MSALRGENRTETNQLNRGNGLPIIYDGYLKNEIKDLVIISKRGYIKNNTEQLIPFPLKGTLYSWRVENANVKSV